ncbi:hypothetical protein [Planobispora longispora]|nr:hypothetical protein [Planobispora longispora]
MMLTDLHAIHPTRVWKDVLARAARGSPLAVHPVTAARCRRHETGRFPG